MKAYIPENSNRRRRICKLKKPEFPCFCCGICCSKFQPRLSLSEARILAHNLGISWERFLAEYIDPHWPGSRSYLLCQIDGACIFLRTGESKKPKLCLIHDFKPTCCAEWKQGINRSECLEGLKTDWDLTMDSSGKICGSQEKIQAFERFILVLNKTLSK
jgi:Fe-S-cluster containining protein